MQTTIRSLAWKEWHEHKWKLASIVAAVWTLAAYMLWASRHEPDALNLIVALSGGCCILPLSMFIGASDAAGERSHRTLPFLQSLPVSPQRVALAKLAFGIGTIVISVLLSALFVLACVNIASAFGVSYIRAQTTPFGAGTSITGNSPVDVILMVISVGVSIYLWSAAVGVHCKDEVSASAMAVLAMIGWWLLLVLAGKVLHVRSTDDVTLPVLVVGLSTAPASAFLLRSSSQPLQWLGIATGVAWHVVLAAHYVRHFGKTAVAERFSPRSQALPSTGMLWLPSPRATRFTAIVWKQCRECAPIALVGVLGTLAIVVVSTLFEDRGFRQLKLEQLLDSMLVSSIYFGYLIAIVMGIAVCHSDTSPKANEFWRSRPIPIQLWFWTRFGVGLLFVLLLICVPILSAVWLAGQFPNSMAISRMLYTAPLIHVAAYAAAVAMACLVRNAGYAAILSIPAGFAGLLLVYAGIDLARHFGWIGPAPPPLTAAANAETIILFVTGGVLSFVAHTLLAWLATWFDWGRKLA